MPKVKAPVDAIKKLKDAQVEEKKQVRAEEVKTERAEQYPEVFYVVREIDIKNYELLKIRCNPSKIPGTAIVEDKVLFENRVAGRGFTLDQQGLQSVFEKNKRRNL